MWERYKTGPAHNRCWNCSPFTSKHTWIHFSEFWNSFHKVSMLTAWISWRITSLSCSNVRGVFLYALPFSRPPKNRSRQALDRVPPVSNFLTNFWMQHFDGARLSPNSVRNAVWHALNESYVYGTLHHLYSWVKRNQLDATYFIIYSILIQCSACFGR